MLCTGIWKRQEHGHEEDEHGHEADGAQQAGVSEESSTSLSLSLSHAYSDTDTLYNYTAWYS